MPPIAGVVVDETGQPITGVSLRALTPGQRGRSLRIASWCGETDQDGHFEAELASGDYDLFAHWKTGTSRSARLETEQRITAGNTDIRIVLDRGATITGRVLLEGGPMPYYGVTVSPSTSISMGPITVRNPEGRFTVPHLGPGTWRIAIRGPGTREHVVSVPIDRPQIDLGDIAMERGQRLTGCVRDAHGTPVHDARVMIGRNGFTNTTRSQLGLWFMGQFEKQTDADGAYAFEGIDHEVLQRPRTVWAQHDVHGASLIAPVPDDHATLDLALLPAGEIGGTVTGLHGQRSPIFAVRADEPELARSTFIEGDGSFLFRRVPAGRYLVRMQVPPCESAPVTVSAHETATITVTAPPTVTVQLHLPPGGANQIRSEPLIMGFHSVSHQGTEDHYTFNFVLPGAYRFSLDGTTWTDITIAPEPEQQTIDLRGV